MKKIISHSGSAVSSAQKQMVSKSAGQVSNVTSLANSARAVNALAMQAQGGNEQARTSLLESLYGYVLHLAAAYVNSVLRTATCGDLAMAGLDGIIKAIPHYNPFKGASFKTFATPYIIKEIFAEIRGDYPITMTEYEYNKMRAEKEDWVLFFSRDDDRASKKADIFYDDDEDEYVYSKCSHISADSYYADSSIDSADVMQVCHQVLSKLPQDQVQVFQLRHPAYIGSFAPKLSYQAVGEALNRSGEWARQVDADICAAIRKKWLEEVA